MIASDLCESVKSNNVKCGAANAGPMGQFGPAKALGMARQSLFHIFFINFSFDRLHETLSY